MKEKKKMEASDFSMGELVVCYVILLITNGLSLYGWNDTINRAKASNEEWSAMVDEVQDLTSKVLQHNTDQQELLEKISGNYAELYAVVQRYLMLVHHIDVDTYNEMIGTMEGRRALEADIARLADADTMH